MKEMQSLRLSLWIGPEVVLFIIIILFTQFIDLSCGSHYGKFHISDYCDSSRVPSIVQMSTTGNMSALSIRLKREAYRPGMNCTLMLRAPPGLGLLAFVPKMKLRRFNKQKVDRLELLSSSNQVLFKLDGYNQEVEPHGTFFAKPADNQLTIHFFSDHFDMGLAGKGFKIVVTVFSLTQNKQCNNNSEIDFNCGSFCISPMLECDGIDNCRNNRDEMECDETSETKLSLYVFLLTLFVMAILVTIFMMKNKDKRKEIVRRMSRVYGNNPILFVMDNSNDFENQSANSPTFHNSSPTYLKSSFITPNSSSRMSSSSSIPNNRSKLSLSLPHGINQIPSNSSIESCNR